MELRANSLVAAMALGQVGGLLPHVPVPAVMPAGAYALGYMALVPFLTTQTDRVDARFVRMGSSLVRALAIASVALWWRRQAA